MMSGKKKLHLKVLQGQMLLDLQLTNVGLYYWGDLDLLILTTLGNLNRLTNKVMMIINSTKRFLWTNIQKSLLMLNKHNMLSILCLSLFISCNKTESLKVQPLKTESGWGYIITKDEKIIIKQTFIPVISENKSFKTEDQALKVGSLVLQKLKDNLSPTITKKDLFLLAIKT
jgi:hypothetical protein